MTRKPRRSSREESLHFRLTNLKRVRHAVAESLKDLEKQIRKAQSEWLAEARKGGRGWKK